MKLGILVCALCGLASAFVGGDQSVWAARGAMGPSVAMYIAGFAIAALAGAWMTKRSQERHHAVIALVGTACALFWYRDSFGDLAALRPLRDHALGGVLFSIGFYGGIVCAIAAVAKPEKR
jgi:hypothetical protein